MLGIDIYTHRFPLAPVFFHERENTESNAVRRDRDLESRTRHKLRWQREQFRL